MINLKKMIIEEFLAELDKAYKRTYGLIKPDYGSVLVWVGNLSLELIGNSDALYHDVDHTMMVTLAGQDILIGKHLTEGGVSPEDWLHFMIALLCHDIGYVKWICQEDKEGFFATGIGGQVVKIPEGGTDAALTPYHVDRGKLFIRERFGRELLVDVDTERINSFIEMTRFPVPGEEIYRETQGFGGLLRAADFIGQLGDPYYLNKIPALFYEFEETGINQQIGYLCPGDMRAQYAKFFWKTISPFIQEALIYLRATLDGRQWIANLYSHLFSVEHDYPF
jgi:hypothetical protein